MAQKRIIRRKKLKRGLPKAQFGMDLTSMNPPNTIPTTGVFGQNILPNAPVQQSNATPFNMREFNLGNDVEAGAFNTSYGSGPISPTQESTPIDLGGIANQAKGAIGNLAGKPGVIADAVGTLGSAMKFFGREDVKPVQTDGSNLAEGEIAALNASQANAAANEAAARDMATNAAALGATAVVGPLGGMAVKAGEGLSNMIKGDSEEGSTRSLIGGALSVSGKTGIADFAKGDYGMGLANIATGGMAGVADEYLFGADRAKDKEVKRRKLEDYSGALKNRATVDPNIQKRVYATGTEGIENTKAIEVEKDEIVMRKDSNGRFTKVADFKGGKSHMQGGEDYIAQEGDVIYPGNKRKEVNRMINQHDHVGLETMRMKLPKDSVSKYKNGTRAIDTDDKWSTMTTQELSKLTAGMSAYDKRRTIDAYNKAQDAKANSKSKSDGVRRNYNMQDIFPNKPVVPPKQFGGYSSESFIPDWAFDQGRGVNSNNFNIVSNKNGYTKDGVQYFKNSSNNIYYNAKGSPDFDNIPENEVGNLSSYHQKIYRDNMAAHRYDPNTSDVRTGAAIRATEPAVVTPRVTQSNQPMSYEKDGETYIKNTSNNIYYNKKGSPDLSNIPEGEEKNLSSYYQRLLRNNRLAGRDSVPTNVGGQQNYVSQFGLGDWALGNYTKGGSDVSNTPVDVNATPTTTPTTTGTVTGTTTGTVTNKGLGGGKVTLPGKAYRAPLLSDDYIDASSYIGDSDVYPVGDVATTPGVPAQRRDAENLIQGDVGGFGEYGANILDYAPALYNIARGTEAPEQVDRTYLSRDANRLSYRDMSDPMRRKALEMSRIAAANAGATSGGVAGVSGARKAAADASYLGRLGEIDAREIARADAINLQNAQMNQGIEGKNIELKNMYEDLDARNRAVPEAYTDRGIADMSKIRSQQRLDARKDRYQDMVVKMLGTNNFRFGGDTKKGLNVRLT